MEQQSVSINRTGTPGRETGVVVALLTPPGRGALAVVGVAGAAAAVGGTALLLAALAVWRQSETYGTDLDFVEG